MTKDDARERIDEIEEELADLYDLDFDEAERDEIIRRAERSSELETELTRLQGWLNVHGE
jgi:hypothetical protein